MKLSIYKINIFYIKYLQCFDHHVMWPKEILHERPYIGVVIHFDDYDYFAPMSSNIKNKAHWSIINFGPTLGSIFLVNMIPVPISLKNELLTLIDVDEFFFDENPYKESYGLKLFGQSEKLKDFSFIKIIQTRANDVYRLQKHSKGFMNICCNFSKLEYISLFWKRSYWYLLNLINEYCLHFNLNNNLLKSSIS